MRKNKTVNNLKQVWWQLDNACGEMDNAINNLSDMTVLSDEMNNKVEKLSIDFINLVTFKNEIEELIEEKEKEKVAEVDDFQE